MSKVNQLLKEIAGKKAGFSFSSVLNILTKKKKELKLPEIAAKEIIPAPIRNENVTLESLQNEIRILAYSLWEKAGCPEGDGSYFWEKAEKEIFGPEPLKDGGYYVYVQRKNGSINLQLIK